MICVFLADGFEELEAFAPIDILKRADIKVKTVGAENIIVKGANGIKTHADMLINNIDKSNLEGIILPGGMPGTINLKNNSEVQKIIDYCAENNLLIGAICAAPIILGEKGLLMGKKACCYPGFEKHLKGAQMSEEAVCVSQNIITSKGPGTALEFAFELLKYLKGANALEKIKGEMQYFR